VVESWLRLDLHPTDPLGDVIAPFADKVSGMRQSCGLPRATWRVEMAMGSNPTLEHPYQPCPPRAHAPPLLQL
jgi:hypothetical protein